MNARGFLSDNASGVHPKVLEALATVNEGHVSGYGDDPYTERAEALFREHFGEQARALLVSTGTAANVIGLKSVLRSYEAVIASEHAHLHEDECGAPEKFLGSKLLTVPAHHGKVRADDVLRHLVDADSVHRAQPRVLSISQCTEAGTVYSLDELRALADACHANGLYLHVDGARLANAAVSLECSLKALTTDVGVDVLSVGGTKNGLLAAEAAVFLNPELGQGGPFFRKQGMQLLSKMRFIAAQWIAYLEGDLWRENATAANRAATRLHQAVKDIPGVEVLGEPDANAVFARIDPRWVEPLQEVVSFYLWSTEESSVRWMCSFDTQDDDIELLANELRALAQT